LVFGVEWHPVQAGQLEPGVRAPFSLPPPFFFPLFLGSRKLENVPFRSKTNASSRRHRCDFLDFGVLGRCRSPTPFPWVRPKATGRVGEMMVMSPSGRWSSDSMVNAAFFPPSPLPFFFFFLSFRPYSGGWASATPGYRLVGSRRALFIGSFIAHKIAGVQASPLFLFLSFFDWSVPVSTTSETSELVDPSKPRRPTKIVAHTARAEASPPPLFFFSFLNTLPRRGGRKLRNASYLADRQYDAIDAYQRLQFLFPSSPFFSPPSFFLSFSSERQDGRPRPRSATRAAARHAHGRHPDRNGCLRRLLFSSLPSPFSPNRRLS